MSRDRNILIMQVEPAELRFVHAAVRGMTVEFVEARTFRSGRKSKDTSILQNSEVLGEFAAHVRSRGHCGKDVVCVIGGPSVACHYFNLPPLAPRLLRQAVLLKLGQELHFPVAEAAVAIQPSLGAPLSAGGETRLHASAAHRDVTSAVRRAIERASLNLVAMAAAPDVLAAAADMVGADDKPLTAILHLDRRASMLISIHHGSPQVATELPVCVADLAEALMRPILCREEVIQLDERRAWALLDEVGIPKADQHVACLGVGADRLLPLLEPVLQKLAKQLTQWLTFSATCTGGDSAGRLRLVGPAAAVPGLAEAIEARIGLPVSAFSWLDGFVDRGSGAGSLRAGDCDLAAAAALTWNILPDLTPSEVRKSRALRRLRRLIAVGGFSAAAAIVGVALSFEQLNRNVADSVDTRRELLDQVQRTLSRHMTLEAEAEAVQRLEEQFGDFAGASVAWVGVFKELSLMLPAELQATEYSASGEGPDLTLRVRAAVYSKDTGRGFDTVVSQALLVLQSSAFFRRVELVSAKRAEESEATGIAGELAIDLLLVFPGEKARV